MLELATLTENPSSSVLIENPKTSSSLLFDASSLVVVALAWIRMRAFQLAQRQGDATVFHITCSCATSSSSIHHPLATDTTAL